MKILSALFALVLAGTAFAFQPGEDGSWYDPAHDGQGFSVSTFDDGWAAAWFTYDPSGNQAWFVTGLVEYGETAPLYFPMGFFPAHSVDIGEPVGTLTVTPIDTGYRARYKLDLWDSECMFAPGQPIPPRPGPVACAGEFNLIQLQ